MGQKEPPRHGSTICYGQEWARKRHRSSVLRFVTAKSWPERGSETRQYDLLRARDGHQDSAVRFVTAKSGRERATETRQYDLIQPRCGPERATKTRQYDLLRPRLGQKEPPRPGNMSKSHRDSAVRSVTRNMAERATKTWAVRCVTTKRGPEREPPSLSSTICYGQELGRKSHRDSAVRFVTAKSGPERGTETRQYDLIRPRVGQKEPPRLGSTICYDLELARKSHRDSAVRFVAVKSWPEELPRLGSTICYAVTAKSWPEAATKTRQYDLLRPRVGQKKPPRLGSTICYGQEWARKSHHNWAVRFFTAKSWPERGTETRQYDSLPPNVVQKEPPRLSQTEPPRLGSAIYCGQELARRSH